jgi:hypothetical protein
MAHSPKILEKSWKSKPRKLLNVKYIANGIRIAALDRMSDIDLYLSMLHLGVAEPGPNLSEFRLMGWAGWPQAFPQTSASSGPVRHSGGVCRR